MTKIAHVDFEKLRLTAGSTILDLGCGRGQVLIPLMERDYKVFEIDLHMSYLKVSREKCKKKTTKGTAKVINANAKQLPFASNVFDIVVCREVLEHIARPGDILSEIHGTLRQGGRLCITVPSSHTERYFQFVNPRWLAMAGHVNVFSRARLASLLKEHGFDVVDIRGENFFYTVYWFFHTIIRTEHDGTGRILEHHKLEDLIFRMWRRLGEGRLKRGINKVGNGLLPKSYAYYAVKRNAEVQWENRDLMG